MQIPGETFYIEPAARSSWVGVVERAGFTVEDRSLSLTEAGRELGYEFAGVFKHYDSPGKVYKGYLVREGTDFVLRIRSKRADSKSILEGNAFLRKTLGAHLAQKKTHQKAKSDIRR